LKLAFDPPALQIALGKLVKNILPGLQQHTKLDANAISSIPAEVQRYKNDPLVHDFITPAFFLGVFEASDWALANASDFTLPLYIYHGTKDSLISPEGTRLFAEKVKGDITTKFWEGQYHEAHHDQLRQEVMQATADWILSHC
jgi:alpha-beta hydrolase superfamily lysophospholipase